VVPVLLLAFIAASPSEQYNRGNAAYEAGDYATAVVLYDSAAAQVTHADILFNRGNARFKTGEVGRAIADYARAHVIDPHDPDSRHNLEFARAYRPDKVTVLPNPVIRLLAGVLRALSLGTARVLTGCLFLAAAAALSWFLVRGSRAGLWFAVGAGALFLYALASFASWAGEVNPARAVVVVPELALRSGPGDDYKDMLVVHDGLEVTVRQHRGRFVLVQVPGGQGGWADSSAFERMFPPR